MTTINPIDPLEQAMSDAVNNYGNAILTHIEQQIKPLREQIEQLQQRVKELEAGKDKGKADHD